jgi:hypothetical protein
MVNVQWMWMWMCVMRVIHAWLRPDIHILFKKKLKHPIPHTRMSLSPTVFFRSASRIFVCILHCSWVR